MMNTLWMGNFNWHHPLWDKERNSHLFTRANMERAQLLLNMLGCYEMKMVLPLQIPTLKAHNGGNLTWVNVFCTEELLDAIIKCNTDEE